MSTEIKPGQVWASRKWPEDGLHVDQVRRAHVEYTWVGGTSHVRTTDEFLDAFELVKDTTPAPLDPSKVKAGDTVTLDSDELAASVTGRVTDIQHDHGAWTIYLTLGVMGHSTPFVVGVGTSWALTDLQPAPKPEWDPGTSGTATVRTIPNVRVMRLDGVTQPWVSVTFFAPAGDVKGEGQNRHDDWQVADFVPDETRPLPTRDQVAEAVMTTDKATGNHGLYPDVATKAADAVLALLRGESR